RQIADEGGRAAQAEEPTALLRRTLEAHHHEPLRGAPSHPLPFELQGLGRTHRTLLLTGAAHRSGRAGRTAVAHAGLIGAAAIAAQTAGAAGVGPVHVWRYPGRADQQVVAARRPGLEADEPGVAVDASIQLFHELAVQVVRRIEPGNGVVDHPRVHER